MLWSRPVTDFPHHLNTEALHPRTLHLIAWPQRLLGSGARCGTVDETPTMESPVLSVMFSEIDSKEKRFLLVLSSLFCMLHAVHLERPQGLRFQTCSMKMLWGLTCGRGSTSCSCLTRLWMPFAIFYNDLNELDGKTNGSPRSSSATLEAFQLLIEALRDYWAAEEHTEWYRNHPIFQDPSRRSAFDSRHPSKE